MCARACVRAFVCVCEMSSSKKTRLAQVVFIAVIMFTLVTIYIEIPSKLKAPIITTAADDRLIYVSKKEQS